MKLRWKTLSLALVCGLLVVACGDDDDDGAPAPTSLLRVVHNSPDAPDVDVLFNDGEVLSGVPYLTASGYLEVPAGLANLKLRVTGTDTIALERDVDLEADTAYTVIAMNLVADIDAMVLVDNIEPPSEGDTRLRLIHGAVGAPPGRHFHHRARRSAGRTVLERRALHGGRRQQRQFQREPTEYGSRLRRRPTSSSTPGAVTLESGVAYTAIAVDAIGGGAPFSAILLVDQAPAE